MKRIKKIGIFMLKIGIIGIVVVFIGDILGSFISNDKNVYNTDENVIIYLNKNEASAYLERTNYYSEQNRLSVSLKTKEEVQYDDPDYKIGYKKYVVSNLNDWKGNEKKYLNKRFAKILPYIKKHTSQVLVDTIYLIQIRNPPA